MNNPEEIAKDATNALARLEEQIAEQSTIRRQAVHELRAQGWTYDRIAALLGVTKARAQQLSK